jgi:CheY-like chemotaxis protein
MVDRANFNEVIKDMLGNLYDTAAIETHPMIQSVVPTTHSSSGNRGEYLRTLILEAIEQLRPPRKEESINSPEWRPYHIIYKRYVEGMGIQELSDQLAISTRQMRRDHHRAFMALTEILWAKCNPDEQKKPGEKESETAPVIEVHNEIINADETTRGVCKMLKYRFDEKGVSLTIHTPENSTPIITDRVILRQALIGIFNQSLHIQNGHEILIDFRSGENRVDICITLHVSALWEPASVEEIDDDLNAVRYWCSMINATLEEQISKEEYGQLIRWTIALPISNQRILMVIDDQPAVVSMFKRYLSQSNLLAIGVEHPDQAIEMARLLQPVLITLDVMMPQMDGWELLQMLKLDKKIQHIPIVVCSAWDDPDLSRLLGAAAFLKKPVTQKMLLETIDRLLPSSSDH